MVNKVSGKKGGKPEVPKFAQELNSTFQKSTSYEASTSDERLQRMLDKNAELEEQLAGSVNGSEGQRILAEQLAFSEEETYQHSLKVDKTLTEKAKKVYAKGFDVQSRVNNITRRATTESGTERFTSQARGSEELNLPQSVIESRIQESIAKTSSYTEGIANRIRTLKPGEETDDIVKASAGISKYRDETARLMAIKTEQNRAGLSTQKLTGRYEDIKEDLGGFRNRTEIERKLSSGEHKSFAEESATLNKKESQLGEAFEKLSNTVKGAGESVDDFNKRTMDATKEFTKLADEVEKQATLTKGVERKEGAAGGGGFFKKNEAVLQMAQMGLQAVGTVAGAYEDIAVKNDIRQVSNRAKFAKMGNAIYDQAASAVSGYNVDAMLDIVGDAGVKRYADMQKTKTNIASGVKIATNGAADVIGSTAKGTAIGTAAGVAIAAGETFLTGGVGAVGAPAIISGAASIGGTIGAISATSRAAVSVDDLVKGNVGADTSISAYHARKELNREERYVASQNMQAFYSQGINSYSAIQGMGSGASGNMQKRLMDGTDLKNLAYKGVTPEEAVKLTGILTSAGSIEGGSDAGLRMIEGAGRAAQRGQMGKEEYVSTAARMVAAGGKDNELEDIISAGMTRGMDNSKNIGQMVDATLSMSSGLASKGISGTGVMGDAIGGMTQSLVDKGMNKNLATNVAASGIADLNRGLSDTGFNLGNIVDRAAIRQVMPGITTGQVNKISKMEFDDLKLLQAGGPEAERYLKEQGLNNRFMKNGEIDQGIISRVSKDAYRKVLINKGLMGDAQGIEIMNKWGTGKELSPDAKAWFGPGSELGNISTYESLSGLTKRDKITNENYNSIGMNLGAEAEKNSAQYLTKKIDAGRIAAGEMLSTQKGKEFEGLEGLAKSISESVDPVKWGDEVKAAADKFSVPAADLLTATSKLEGTVKSLLEYQNRMLDKMGKPIGAETKIESEEKPSPFYRTMGG